MRYAARVDKNQAEIVAALKAVGWSVELTHRLGDDFPDLIVARNKRTVLLEVKSEDGTLSDGQMDFINRWRGEVYVVRSVSDAFKALGVGKGYTVYA